MYQPVAWEGNIVNVNYEYQISKQNIYQPVAWGGNMDSDLHQINVNQLPGKVTWSWN